MKKLCLIASVAVFASLAAAPAKADVVVVRWNSGMCQIWDNAAGPPPWPQGEFAVVARGLPDWAAGGAAVNGLYGSGKCGWVAVAPAPQPVFAPPPPPPPPAMDPPPPPWLLPPPWAVPQR